MFFFNFILTSRSFQLRSPLSPSPSLPDLVPDFVLGQHKLPVKGGGWKRGRSTTRKQVRSHFNLLFSCLLICSLQAQHPYARPSRPMQYPAAGSAPLRPVSFLSEAQLRGRLAAVQAEIRRLSSAQKELFWQLQSLRQRESCSSSDIPQVRFCFYNPLLADVFYLGRLSTATIAPLPTTLSPSAPSARLLISPRFPYLFICYFSCHFCVQYLSLSAARFLYDSFSALLSGAAWYQVILTWSERNLIKLQVLALIRFWLVL